jgi:hypothetical protein
MLSGDFPSRSFAFPSRFFSMPERLKLGWMIQPRHDRQESLLQR